MGAPLLLSSLRRKVAARPSSSSSSSLADKNAVAPHKHTPSSPSSSNSSRARMPFVSLRNAVASSDGPGGSKGVEDPQQQHAALNKNNMSNHDHHPSSPNNIGEVDGVSRNIIGEKKPRRSSTSTVHLNIAPADDAAESESMQVSLVPEGEASPAKGGDCAYTVHGVDYLVKHKTNCTSAFDEFDAAAAGDDADATAVVAENCEGVAASFEGGEGDGGVENKEEKRGEERSTRQEDPDATNLMVVEAAGGGKEKKKSKMGSLFKKGGKKGGGGGDKEKGSDDNRGGGGDQHGDERGDDAGDSNGKGGDDDKKDSGDKNGGGRGNAPNGNGGTPFDPLAYFGPERASFASQSTLPLHAGPESDAPADQPSWTPVDGTEFKVRRGPNYPKNGKKESSLPSLYEVYGVRYFRSEKRTVGGATRIMPLPELPEGLAGAEAGAASGGDDNNNGGVRAGGDNAGGGEGAIPSIGHHPELHGTKIPDVLVVHFMLPYEPPNVFKQKDDSSGGECVYYLRPTRRFLDEYSGRVPTTPATTLFARWCAECESDPKVRGRFKCMALVRDIDKHNFGLLKTYNGKPVLITESGRACSGYHGDVRYLEMTANVHHWAFMAKKGFVSLIPKFANMQMEVGFNIEAHADSEMPECMLGSTVLSYISETTGPMISAEMQEPVHEHQS